MYNQQAPLGLGSQLGVFNPHILENSNYIGALLVFEVWVFINQWIIFHSTRLKGFFEDFIK